MRKNNFIFTVTAALIYIATAIYIFHSFLWQDGILGYRHDGGYFFYSLSYFKEFFVSIWDSQGLGQFSVYDGTSFLISIIVYLLSLVGVGSAIFSKIFAILAFSGAAFSFYALMRHWRINPYAALLVGFIYGFNPVTYNNFIAGYYWYLLAYLLAPLILIFFEKALIAKKSCDYWKNILLAALFLAIAASQIHFVIMIGVLLVLRSLVGDFSAWKILKSIIFIYAMVFLIHSPWIITFLFLSGDSINTTTATATVSSWNKIMSSSLSNGFNLTSFYENRYFLADIGKNSYWIITSTLITISAFLALVFKRTKKIAYLALIVILGIFLSKGTNIPMEKISELIYNLPGFSSIFRQSYHWIFLAAFGMAALLGFTISALIQQFKNIWVGILIILIFLIIFATYTYPFFNSSINKEVDSFKPDIAYDQLYQKECLNNSRDYRLMWIPGIGPFKENSMRYSINFDPFIDNFCQKSFGSEGGILFFDGQATILRNFVFYSLYNNLPINNLGKLLGIFNVVKIINRTDYTSEYNNTSNLKDFPDLAAQWSGLPKTILASQTGVQKQNENDPITEYINQVNQPKIYLTQCPLVTSQNLSILLSESINNNSAFLFADQLIGKNLPENVKFDIKEPYLQQAIFNRSTTNINPASTANTYFNAQDGWIRGQNWFWYNPTFAQELNNFIFTIKPDRITIPLDKAIEPGSYLVLVKYFTLNSQVQTELQFDNNTAISLNNPNSNKFEWVKTEIDLSNTSNKLTINTTTGNSAVGDVLLIPNDKLNPLPVDNLCNDNQNNANSVSYTKISNTKYQIEINNQNPTYLIFSESFHTGWKLYNEKGEKINAKQYIVNGYANAYYIDEIGKHTYYLEFEPQKYYQILLYFSLVFCLVIITTIIYLSLRQNNRPK